MTRLKYSLFSGIILGIIVYIYCLATSKDEIAIVIGLFCFILFSVISYFKIFFQIRENVIFQKFDKNKVIYSGLANHVYNGITVGGKMYLLSNKLIFQSNLMNFTHKHELTIELNQIINIDFSKTMDVIDNGLVIETYDKNREQFVVNKREVWKDLILNKTRKENKI